MSFRAVWTWPGWRSTKPQKVVVFMAVDMLDWKLSSSFRDQCCSLHTYNWKGIVVGLSNRGKGRNGVGWGEVMVDRASDIAQGITEIRSKSYQLLSLPQIHQSFPQGLSIFPHINILPSTDIQNLSASGVFSKDLLWGRCAPSEERSRFTSFDQCSLLLFVGSKPSGKRIGMNCSISTCRKSPGLIP